jgi:hypothetical protein
MTILNTASDGLFNVLIVLHRTLTTHGPMDEDRLIRLCSPAESPNKDQLRQTLRRWKQLGLFRSGENDKLTLDKADKNPDRLPANCRRLLFSDENNQRFWDNESALAADFTRALAFILAQDIYVNEFGAHAKVQALEHRQFRDESRRLLQNDTRWNGLRHWGDYLGFFWEDQRRWPDPTAAIREELPEVFGGHNELPAQDFITRLGERLPVLDGGRYRLEIEAALDPAEWQSPARPDLLSTSLSRALWRLSRPGGPLRFERRADAGDGRTLQRAGGRDWQTFTHVLLTQGV